MMKLMETSATFFSHFMIDTDMTKPNYGRPRVTYVRARIPHSGLIVQRSSHNAYNLIIQTDFSTEILCKTITHHFLGTKGDQRLPLLLNYYRKTISG